MALPPDPSELGRFFERPEDMRLGGPAATSRRASLRCWKRSTSATPRASGSTEPMEEILYRGGSYLQYFDDEVEALDYLRSNSALDYKDVRPEQPDR